MTGFAKPTTGLIVGTFSPPHKGDAHVFEFARHFVDELTIIVLDAADQSLLPMPNRLRWVADLCPTAQMHSLPATMIGDDALPGILQHYTLLGGSPPNFVFGSDPDQAKPLARALGAKYIVTDSQHPGNCNSGNIIADPASNWEHIPRSVRPHFVKRVCIFGPESTGKTTLATNLSRHYDTVCAREWARLVIEDQNDELCESDLVNFARGQIALEDSLAYEANRVLFCDSDALTTSIWSVWLYGRCDQSILELANNRDYDLYLLTHVDVPWVADPQRFFPEKRKEFFDHCLRELETRNRRIVHIRGDWDARFNTAVAAVDQLLAPSQVTV